MRELSFIPKDQHTRVPPPPELLLLLRLLPPGSDCTLQAVTDLVYSLWSTWLPQAEALHA